jgi:predicted neuraminidase
VHPRDPKRLLATLLWLSLRLTVLAAGSGSEGLRMERLFGPEIPTGKYKHPACFTELADGSLYAVFFSGRGEYGDAAASVYGSRLPPGARRWSRPVVVATNPFHALGNAVVWQVPDGVVWLFYVTRYGEVWADARITAKISRDGARTWSEPFQVTFEAGTLVRSRPVVLADGSWLLPVYHEAGRDPEFDDPANTSFFLRRDPATGAWTESNRVRSRLGNVQPAAAVVSGSHLVAFCRRGGDYAGRPDGWLVRTESRDGGRTWSAGADSALPNPNAAVDFIRLASGRHLLAYNHSFTNRTPLTVALSDDGGRTFAWRRDIAAGPEGDFAYPTAVQTRDGRIHVMFTSDERTVVRKAVFTEAWATGGAPPPRP